MSQKMHFLGWLSLIVLLSLVLQTPIQAQEEKPTISAYQIQSADTQMVFDALQTMLEGQDGVRMQADEKAKRIVVVGSVEIQNQVMQIIKTIDQAAQNQKPKFLTFGLKHVDAAETAPVLLKLFEGSKDETLRVTADPRTNGLLVKADDQETLELIRQLIAQMDVPGARQDAGSNSDNCIVRFTWLIDPTGLDAETKAGFKLTPPRASLGKLVDRLKADQTIKELETLSEIRTVAPAANKVGEAQEFTNSTLLSGNYGLNAMGSVVKISDQKFQVDISLEFTPGHGQAQLAMSTKLTLPKNHPVAFSVAHVGEFKSVLVVELLDLE